MKEYTSTAIIDASTDTVWAILTDAIGYKDWNPEILGIDGRMALGQHITAHVRLASGVVRKVKLRVSAFEPPRRMEWMGGLPFGLFTGRRTFTVEPSGKRRRVPHASANERAAVADDSQVGGRPATGGRQLLRRSQGSRPAIVAQVFGCVAGTRLVRRSWP